MVLTDKGIDNLRCAIVQQTAYDYLEYKKSLYKLRDSDTDYAYHMKRSLIGKIGAIVKWFRGDYYKLLCNIDSEYMLEQLNKEFEQWIIKFEDKQHESDPREKKRKENSLYRKKRIIAV